MTTEEDTELLHKYLEAELRPGSKQEQAAQRIVGDVLERAARGLKGDGLVWLVCYDLAWKFRKREIELKHAPYDQEYNVALSVAFKRKNRGDFEAAVLSTKEEFGISRATVTRAYRKYKEVFRHWLGRLG